MKQITLLLYNYTKTGIMKGIPSQSLHIKVSHICMNIYWTPDMPIDSLAISYQEWIGKHTKIELDGELWRTKQHIAGRLIDWLNELTDAFGFHAVPNAFFCAITLYGTLQVKSCVAGEDDFRANDVIGTVLAAIWRCLQCATMYFCTEGIYI